jgi:hypothetical protein
MPKASRVVDFCVARSVLRFGGVGVVATKFFFAKNDFRLKILIQHVQYIQGAIFEF